MNHRAGNITKNIYGFYKRVAKLCAYEWGDLEGCSYVWNREGSWPSFILGSPEPDLLPETIGTLEKRQLPSFWIMEKPTKDELLLLEESGIRVIREWKGMELESSQIPGAKPIADDKITIRINDPEYASDWLSIVNTDLLTGSQMGPEFLDSVSSDDRFRWMVAILDGQPVGTGLSYSENGVCGLYMIATSFSSRGQGVGTCITRELVNQARLDGDDVFVLHATELGARIYDKMGFREVNRYSVLWNLGR